MAARKIRVGADIGGTFTDVALLWPGGLATAKALTDHDAPERAVLEGIRAAAADAGVALAEIEEVIHGTTLVTNALIERRGARTAFVTTEGFRDVVEMRSESRFEQYDLDLQLPSPLIPRKDRFTVRERTGPAGETLLALDPDEARDVAMRVVRGGYESVAVGLMHSYANDSHERAIAAELAALAPDLPVSLSAAVSPQMRELPRFNTVIANAYVRPRVAAYLARLQASLADAGIGTDAGAGTGTGAGPALFLMHSGGGLISPGVAAERPVLLLESGPAGGAIFAAGFAKSRSIDRALALDMGGTTAKICLVEGGTPRTAGTFEIARSYRFKKGSGMTVSTPVIEMVEIGAGGGSLASVDAMDRIRVGPRSAGSDPGPACFGRGGADPAVTDANLVLGRLDPDYFAGGSIQLETGRAETAISRIAGALGMPVAEAATGIAETVDENMANAARVHAIEQGRDIGRFTMVAFGGGAPIHACRLGEKLGIDAILVPPGAGVGSAIGFLRAPFSHESVRGLYQRLDAFDPDAVNAAVEDMEREAKSFVERAAPGARAQTRLVAYMRYRGQGWEIPVPMARARFTGDSPEEIGSAFESAYRDLFGRAIPGPVPEITNWSLLAYTDSPEPETVAPSEGTRPAPARRTRQLYDSGSRQMVAAAVVDRADMTPGAFVDGPAVIVEAETSTVVTESFRAVGQSDGCLLLVRKDARP